MTADLLNSGQQLFCQNFLTSRCWARPAYRPEAFHSVDVDLAVAVAVLVPSVLALKDNIRNLDDDPSRRCVAMAWASSSFRANSLAIWQLDRFSPMKYKQRTTPAMADDAQKE